MLDFACVDPSDFVKNKTETKDRSCEWFTSRSIIILFSLDAFEAVYIMTFWSVSVRGELICFQFIDMLLTSLRQRLGALFHLPSAPATDSKPYNSPHISRKAASELRSTNQESGRRWVQRSTHEEPTACKGDITHTSSDLFQKYRPSLFGSEAPFALRLEYFRIQTNTIQYNTIQYNTIQYNTFILRGHYT